MNLKSLLAVGTTLLWGASSCNLCAQLPEESINVPILRSDDPELELTFVRRVSIQVADSFLNYGVRCTLSFEQGSGHILVPSTNRFEFSPGQLIGPGTLVYPAASGYSWIITAQSYNWEVRFPGNSIFVHPGRDSFPGRTNVLIGFSRQHPMFAGTQYGWVRLERETADTKNAFREDGSAKQITFMPTGFAVNPIPDQPIRAGEPPDLPQLVSEVLPPEEGLPTRVRVSWASGWSNMRLESAVELGNPVQWSPVLEVTGTEAVFELPDDGQLYLRLAYVP